MRGSSYILGALDALVRVGAMSPDYASGAASAVVKSAALIGDSFAQNFDDAYKEWEDKHPGQIISPREARRLVLKSRNWHDQIGPNGGFGNWARTRWNKATHGLREWWGGRTLPPEGAYDREYRDEVNQRLFDYIRDKRRHLPAEVIAALQDEMVRDADFRVEDAKTHMHPYDRITKGLTRRYSDRYRTAVGTAMMRSGLYRPKYDKKSLEPGSRYGRDIPKSYGANRHLFYRVAYKNPLEDSV